LNLVFILGGGLLAYMLWRSSAPLRAGGWRVGAGLGALLLVVVGMVTIIRGDEWVGLPLTALGLALAFAGRFNRRGRARGPQAEGARESGAGGAMSLAEARSILGVDETAGAAEIKAAYLRLIKRLHPDQGGTAGLASKLNAARDRLLANLDARKPA
jgi:hypothetical protein